MWLKKFTYLIRGINKLFSFDAVVFSFANDLCFTILRPGWRTNYFFC